MNAEQLKAVQSPLKEKYKTDPAAALITLRARGHASGLACKVETGKALVEAGLHPATGGDGSQACSGDMLLEALVACAGVTLRAVATSIGVEDASDEQQATLIRLTERYCVVLQTLRQAPAIAVST